jgi:hypothetical protein
MKIPSASDLLRACTADIHSGTDFPTIWNAILKRHPLVVGPPVQTMDDGRLRPVIEIFLITGQRLIFDSASNQFSLR